MHRIMIYISLLCLQFVSPGRAQNPADNFSVRALMTGDHSLRHSPDAIIIKFDKGIVVDFRIDKDGIYLTGHADIDRLNISYDCVRMKRIFAEGFGNPELYVKLGLGNIYRLTFGSPGEIQKMSSSYLETGKFQYVEPDFVGYGGGTAIIPDDTYFFRQWSLKNDGTFPPSHPGEEDADIDMDDAWEIEQGDPSIVVGILDSGCKLDHVELAGRIWLNDDETQGSGEDDDDNGYVDDYIGWDFAYVDNQPVDGFGHGTNVTGIVGAIGNNNLGYAGVDWGCKLMICQILNNDNWGYYSWWEEAIYYAVNNGANVINMSVGGSSYSSSLEDAVNYAYGSDVTICACMMNENNSVPYYPAAYENTFAVGATDTDDDRCNPFFWGGGSNFGDHIDVVAPGNYIYGLHYLDSYDFSWYWGGTSQAAPHVSGLASLLLAKDNSLTVDGIRYIITNTAEDQVGNPQEDTPGWDQYYGYGRINAAAALSFSGGDCAYIAGDVNNNGTPLELGDVVAMIGNYRGTAEPAYTCDCGVDPPGPDFAATADPNGNCIALELGDVVTEIGAYRGTTEALSCPDCPGSLRLLPGGQEQPVPLPRLKSKVRIGDKRVSQ